MNYRFLMSKLTTLLKVTNGIENASIGFQKQWHRFQQYRNDWDLNKVNKIKVLEMI